jgi:hypothetical protein
MTTQKTPTSLDHQARLAAGQACLEAAINEYLPRGMAITCCCDPHHIGVGRDHGKTCDSPGKRPIHTWEQFQTRLPTTAEVQQYWKRFPYGNVGCVLGQVSGVVRADVDGPEGEKKLLQWSNGDIPATWEFRSSADNRGLLYAWPRDLPCKTTSRRLRGEHEELRLMGNGSQTVLPPSRHPSGSFYAWVQGHSPHDIPLAPAPAWLIERLQADEQTQPSEATGLPGSLPTVDINAIGLDESTVNFLHEGVRTYPSRSEAAFGVLIRLIRAGLDDMTIAAAFMDPANKAGEKAREQGQRWLADEISRARNIVRKSLQRYRNAGMTGEQIALALWPQGTLTASAQTWLTTELAQLGEMWKPTQQSASQERNGLHNAASGLNSYTTSEDATHEEPHKIRTKGLRSLHSLSSYPEWPTLASDALYGLAGEIVTTIAPQSEADPVALLIQFLAYFGVLIGRHAYYQVEATKHYANLNSCLVGATAKGRKGTAYDYIEWIMQTVDPSWTLSNVSGGCGSGEGLIAAVRDKTTRREPIKVRSRVTGYEEVETDPGVIDKRLLVYEAEFSSVLKIAGREGNILSEILRKAWETGNLRNTVKNNPMKATGAHIAIIGHITIDELQRTLTTTDAANGFGNRFLWLCVRRSKLLPDGGAFHTVDFNPLLMKLRAVLTKAKSIQHMRRDEDAKTAWHAVYPVLSAERPGLVGTLLARAEAQVLRLSMLYALLDGTDTIQTEHLYAALALWEYVEASVTYIFGTSVGDPVADTLLVALQESYPQGLSRKQILAETFHGNLRADELDRVLRLLQRHELIKLEKLPAEGGRGRPKEIVTYRPYELNECNDLNDGGYLSISKNAVISRQESNAEAGTENELNHDLNTEASDEVVI